MNVVLIPGWHEGDDDMRVFITGRNGKPGLAAHGFRCTIFPHGKEDLRGKIDRFARFIETFPPSAFPIVTFGYSAGALVNRGYLRAYPERASRIAATFQLGGPNWGMISAYMAGWLRLMHIHADVIRDLDVASDFMTWINGTTGRWVPTGRPGRKRWQLDREPWIAPAGSRILNVAARLERYHSQSDGIVDIASATLDGRLPHVFIDDPRANHLNLDGAWNPFTLIVRRWRSDDAIWPRVVDLAVRFFTGEQVGSPNGYEKRDEGDRYPQSALEPR